MESRRPWRRGPDRLGPGRAPVPARGRAARAEPPAHREPPSVIPPFGAESSLARAVTMRAVGLPCPEPLALVRARGPGWTAHGATPDDAGGWAAALASLPPAIAVRPAGRTFGTRLAALTLVEDVRVDQYGSAWTHLELAELLLAAPDEEAWMVEARAHDHPLLRRVVPDARPMPALVALTFLGPGDMPVLLSADLAIEPPRTPRGRRRHGPARELRPVDLATGRLVGGGPGALLPCWGAAQALVARAARAVPGHRAMGWDVLLTCRGPVLADAWSPWRGAAEARFRRLIRDALDDRDRGEDPLGEPLDP